MENFIKAQDKDLIKLNEKFGWSLNLAELTKARDYFIKLGHNPTRAEMETIAQTWSEHCKHKTFSGPVSLNYNGKKIKFSNLFKETIVAATKKLNKKWCLSVFKDNAGIIELSPNSPWALAFKAETHNHPCAIAPYGGAETGVGGVIRDILGVGLGAKPVLNTDNFCFGPLRNKKISSGFLTPEKIFEGVVEGVRDYGNRMGIPTAAGSIHFDESYTFNPLVYVGCVGIMPKDKVFKKVKKGDIVVAIGGPTGRDGIHGATFSSADIDENSASSAVQIGHAVNEKKVLDVIMKAGSLGLYDAITDCGAGGFSSAIGELGEETGVHVDIKKAILKDNSIKPWEIWVSESQERMIMAVPPSKIGKLREICSIEECPICELGVFDGSRKLKVFYGDEKIVDLDMSFLHGGLPKFEKKAVYKSQKVVNKLPTPKYDYNKELEKILSDINVCSREYVIRQYDHEVQGGIVVKPFNGVKKQTPSDAIVIWPYPITGKKNNFEGFAVSHGFSFAGKIDTYKMAFYAIDEAIRSLVCVGADISRTALLDNFCCANPNDKYVLGAFAAAAIGCRDAALLYESPFISGKDSFYNQSSINGKEYRIDLSLLISAIAPVKDIRKAITCEFKRACSPIYLVGEFALGLGASVYSRLFSCKSNKLAEPQPKKYIRNYKALSKAIEKGYILAAHDISKGGLATALAKMSFDEFSCEVDMGGSACERGDIQEILFSEGPGMIIVEVDAEKEKDFLKMMSGADIARIGKVVDEEVIRVKHCGKEVINADIEKLLGIWKNSLGEKI